MDVYGYTPYQYNESDELAKQMFAQQALASSGPYPRQESARHSMPAPTGLPWSAQGLPWGMQSPPQLVQFTANPFKDGKFNSVVHCKRKSMDMEPPIPVKQLITEEKMAAHLSGLHISPEYTAHALAPHAGMDTAAPGPAATDMDTAAPGPAATGMDTEPALSALHGRTIVLADEIKNIPDEDIIPHTLRESVSRYVQQTPLLAPLQPSLVKPQMSLVVWRPRDALLPPAGRERDAARDRHTHKKRNGVLVTPHTHTTDVDM